ncbi:unnamed protein product [Urochloa humidicola]
MSYSIELEVRSPLYNSIKDLRTAATKVNNEQKELQKLLLSKQMNKDSMKIRQLNDRLMQAEQAFTSREGIFKQEWFKHLVYGPSEQNDWDTAAYPGIANVIATARSSNTSESWKSVQHEIYRVSRAVTQASAILSGRLT